MLDSRNSKKAAVIGGVAAAVVGLTGVGVYALVGSDSGSEGNTQGSVAASDDGKGGSDEVKKGPPSTAEVRATAKKFLGAWAQGDLKKAARLTDDKATAHKALSGFRTQGRAAKVSLTPKAAQEAKVPFALTARISYKQKRGALNYESSLEVVRDKTTGKTVVDWKPSVLHPRLKDGQTIRTDASGTPPIKAVDRSGAPLTEEDHPTLGDVIDDVGKRYGDKTDGSAGVQTRIVDPKNKSKNVVLRQLSKPTPGELKTTIDAKAQTAAEAAVRGKSKASVVAVKPSTGEILAVANSPAKGFNSALRGSLAPGSTMKVVTGAMLLDKGLASPGKAHPCPKYETYGGWKFQNLDKFEIKNGTFAQSFARSCNTAFISQAKKLKDDDLTKEARDVFGIGLDWKTGTGTFDGSVPVQSDAQMASSLIGQGAVRMNPLTMASVSATVQSGSFKQPVIVPASLDNRTLAKAPRTMKPTVAKDLKGLMRLTATSGTAAEALSGLSGDVGGKTGSAEVDGQKKPNAWFTAYSGDVAAAAVVPASGHGGDNAGPVVRKVLDAAR
ncbi:penicillin-binding transpeptidase domain-containing protein [Streptomyces iconiensis]|uniref:Penicillin-binding transpeptidase domain-containing protein n=1 Tax=Streptomyces iconiensis TaxID=1384038 RepID=A0ABT7ABR2_9ACTN|nr:penicillin-binding transpeptidase domain-containing protein [Streptomyces iconiensis]MDJ1138507.1 penicillin-binding transpeptidase domain-containing protein [Streptomyces iconiensis]